MSVDHRLVIETWPMCVEHAFVLVVDPPYVDSENECCKL